MTPEERQRRWERLKNLSPEEKAKLWSKLKAFCEDICDSCGGSISELDHAEGCQHPDWVEWRRVCALSNEECEQELRDAGYDVEAGRTRFRALLDRLEAKAIERIRAEGAS